MKRRSLSILAGLALLVGAGAAQAQGGNSIKFGLCYDLSKAYTFVTPQIVQAAKDYAAVLNAKGRHDPCVVPRAVVLVETMAALVLADLFLEQRARHELFAH